MYKRQAVLGLVTMIVLMRIDYRKFNRPIVVFPAVAVTTLLLLGVFLLRDSHNTHRWIDVYKRQISMSWP